MNGAATLILFYPMLVFMKLRMCYDYTDTRCLMYSLRVSIVAFKLEFDTMMLVVHKKGLF